MLAGCSQIDYSQVVTHSSTQSPRKAIMAEDKKVEADDTTAATAPRGRRMGAITWCGVSVVVCLGCAGCGAQSGDVAKKPSRASTKKAALEFVDDANETVRGYRDRYCLTAGPLRDAMVENDYEGLASGGERLASIYAGISDDLDELAPPAEYKDDFERVLDAYDGLERSALDLEAAAHAGPDYGDDRTDPILERVHATNSELVDAQDEMQGQAERHNVSEVRLILDADDCDD